MKFLNSKTKKISLSIIIIILFSIAITAVVTAASDKMKLNTDIRILEIEPADSFEITNKSGKITTGIEFVSETIDDKKISIEIEHITMMEFVGKTDKINGKYDVIVIGRKIDRTIKNNDYLFNDYKKLENDITDRKSEEIKEFINSGQLVYIDQKISELTDFKLEKNFFRASNDNQKNFVKVDKFSDLKLSDILTKHKENILLRPKINLTSVPNGDEDVEGNFGSPNNRNIDFKFGILSTELQQEEVSVNLYLDINGDGLFKPEEIVKSMDKIEIPNNNLKISYKMNKDFIGYLNWKLEVVRNNNIKSYETGGFILKNLEGKTRDIKVLQIDTNNNTYTSGKNKGSSLDLENNTEFNKLVDDVKDKGYNIIITRKSIEDFNIITSSKKDKLKSIINGQYSMIIIGFNDSYPAEKFSQDSLDELEQFGKTGQGIMFTHDTLWYTGGTINTSTDAKYPIIRRFADYVGQSRYDNAQNKDRDLLGNEIQHDSDKPIYGSAEEKEGATIWSRNNVNTSESTKVYKTNEAMITNYPYQLQNSISVRRTHGQYLQLNLEDENVIPWLNLTSENGNKGKSNNINQYDVRNSYYTYSRGNITFSGTGENTRDDNEYPEDEMKLFVNTIVKAERGANHAPEIVCDIPEEYTEENKSINSVIAEKDYSFNVDAKDFDGDETIVTVTIDGQMLTSDNVDINRLDKNNKFIVDTTDTHRSSLKVTIPATKLPKQGNDVNIKIEAEDSRGDEEGAKSVKEYKLRPIELPKFDIKLQLDTDNLKKIKDVNGNESLDDSTEKMDEKTVKVKMGDKVNVPYNVVCDSIEYGDISSQSINKRQIAILFDLGVENGNDRNAAMNGMKNNVLNKLFEKTEKADSAVIYYDSKQVGIAEDKKVNNAKEQMQKDLDLITTIKRSDNDNGEPKLKEALEKSKDYFNNPYEFKNNNYYSDTEEWSEASKDIIIITNRGVNTESINEIVNEINGNYNVITFCVSNDYKDEEFEELERKKNKN